MLLDFLLVLLILIALWLLAFSAGQVMMLIFPACPGDAVIHPRFPSLSWKPIALLAGIAAGLALIVLALFFTLYVCG